MTWLKPADWSRGDLQCQTSSRRGFSVMCPEISRVQIPSVACNDLLQIKKPWGFWQTWSPSVERWTRHPHASTILWPTSASILSICGAKRASSVSASWVQYEDLEMFQSVRTCMAVHGAVLPGMGPAAADSQQGEHAEVSFWRTFSTFMTGAATTVSKRTHVEKPRSLKGCAAVLLATPIWLCRRWRPFRKPCVSWRKGNSSFCRHGLAHRLQLWLLRAPKIQWAIIFDSRQNGKTNHVWNMQNTTARCSQNFHRCLASQDEHRQANSSEHARRRCPATEKAFGATSTVFLFSRRNCRAEMGEQSLWRM